MALPTGRGMVAKRERARKPENPLLERNQKGSWSVFQVRADNAFSYLQKLVIPAERLYSEPAGFSFPAANE